MLDYFATENRKKMAKFVFKRKPSKAQWNSVSIHFCLTTKRDYIHLLSSHQQFQLQSVSILVVPFGLTKATQNVNIYTRSVLHKFGVCQLNGSLCCRNPVQKTNNLLIRFFFSFHFISLAFYTSRQIFTWNNMKPLHEDCVRFPGFLSNSLIFTLNMLFALKINNSFRNFND